ncbi:MAG: sigma-54 dependent transcriptional regulator [Opitutales bacterium]|nr:sigma-54 dependent transcriptional regulator [Opitutales bacterium]
MPATILIVDDEKHTREGLSEMLEDDYDVYEARNADEAFNLLEAEEFDLVLTDLKMSGKSGLKVIDKAMAMPYRPTCIMMTAYGTVDVAVEAMKRGAFDFVTKPLHLEKLELLLQRALRSRQVEEENQQLHSRLDEKFRLDNFVGQSAALNEMLERVKLVAPSRATILVEGETGTGKELVAQAIHQNSPRARGAFVAVHCAALPANLLESELFGHEKGAFTGAMEKRIGRFEAADGGTLFLDEIGEIDASTQVKLLRFLEEHSFERVGSMKPIKVDVRLVVATNRNLAQMVKKGDFREDLFYRLNVVKIPMPPLRDRKDDIPVLIEHFIKHYAKENGLPRVRVEAETMKVLQNYRWPGNIRELRNFAENAVILHRGEKLTPYDLDRKYFGEEEEIEEKSPEIASHPLSVEENEKKLLRNALREAGGNRTKAAQLMGVSRRTLHRKLAQWPELDVGG